MQNLSFARTILKQSFAPLMLAMTFAALAGCGSGAGGTGTPGDGTVQQVPASISLATSATSVRTDNSNSATITATVLDASNAVIAGQTVQLQTSTGQLSTAAAVTDTTGKVTATFSSGTLLSTNRTATITATITGSTVTGSIPVAITGSTVTLAPVTASGTTGTPIALTATAKNAGGTPVSGQTVRFSIAPSSTGSGTLSAPAATDGNGEARDNLTGTAAGTVNVLAEWLDGNNTVTASTTGSYIISAGAGSVFQVTAPTTSPFAVPLGTTTSVTVNVPATVAGVAVNSVRFATSLGTWQSNGAKVQTVAFGGAGNYTQNFVAGANAGNANIQIDALDASGTPITSANLVLSLSATAASATNITLTPAPAIIPPSNGNNISTATLTAVVRDVANNPVGNAPVLFELVNPSGGGEQISPVVVLTSNGTNGTAGEARSTFTAGTLSTNQQSQIRATVVGTAVQNTATITVGGTAGSIAVGTSSTIASINANTTYQLPVTVLVSDSNGNPVSGAIISVSVWPQYYYKGTRDNSCAITQIGGRFNNEDVNENLILDAGEDIDGPGGSVLAPPFLGAPDGTLWPESASSGTVPGLVTTGPDGTASFNWTYLKQYAGWIEARLRLSTPVAGTQTVTTTTIRLPASAGDLQAPCPLGSSPYN